MRMRMARRSMSLGFERGVEQGFSFVMWFDLIYLAELPYAFP